MQGPIGIAFAVASKTGHGAEGGRRFPDSYVTYLLEQAKALGLTETRLAKEMDKNPIGITRLKNGEGTGISMATSIREYLIGRGLDIPPIPIDASEWSPSTEPRRIPTAADSENEILRLNLIRFREDVGLDQLEAANRSTVAYADILSYERGERVPDTSELRLLAPHYGRRVGDFLEVGDVGPPDPTKIPVASAWIAPTVDDEYRQRLRALIDEINSTQFRDEKKAMLEHIEKATKRKR